MCVCVAEVRTHVFNMFISSAKRSSPDQHKTRSLIARNAFACSVISYSEVNSRGYVVASNNRVCPQCDIVFGGEQQRLSRR